jgi:cytochrome oxidase assembly protein ShyY1
LEYALTWFGLAAALAAIFAMYAGGRLRRKTAPGG